MKKVLHYVSSMKRAGEETFIMNVYRNIDRNKVSFDFLVTDNEEGDYDKEIYSMGGKIYHIHLNRLHNKLKQIDNFYLLKKKLTVLANEYEYFHIHTQHAMDAFLSALAAKMAGIPNVIVHSHNSSTIYNKRTHRIFKILLSCIKINRFACGVDAGKWMYGNRDFLIVNNGIDLTEFKFDEKKRKNIREKMNWSNKYVVGHVGRFNEQKNHNFLIDVFYNFQKNHQEAILVLIGAGELKEKIQNKVRRLKIQDKVFFLGIREDVKDLYQGMDVFVFPSLFEGLPVVLVETQALDLPCIISNTITNEIDINSNIYRLSLSDSVQNWSNKIDLVYRKNSKRIDTQNIMTKKGYNIKDVTEKMQKIYLEN